MLHVVSRDAGTRALLAFLLLSPIMTACAQRPGSDAPITLDPRTISGAQSATLLPGGDYHLATVRPRSEDNVFCSEPSPDWATAFGHTLAVTASGGLSGGPNGSLNVNADTTAAITAMLGRTAGVVALRDGLYAACQAYANDVIGKDAYALILSQYGNLLRSLAAGGTDGTPAAAGTTKSQQEASNGASGGEGAEVAEMQQQALQALLVACISDNDPSLHATSQSQNWLLSTYCRPLFNEVVSAVPKLLRMPIEPGGVTSQHAQVGARPAPSRTVAKIQRMLVANGGDLQVDGLFGPETATAVRRYISTHNGSP